jgi:hypothetical protein
MLNEFRLTTFDGCINSEFQIIENEAPVCMLTLTEVLEHKSTPHQETFSLVFHGPLEPFVPQGTCRLRHEKLGELELFLVPIAQNEKGFQYQAVFNLLLQPRE